jgi:putative membrane protein
MKGNVKGMMLMAAAAAMLVAPLGMKAQAAEDDKKFLANISQAGVNEIKLSELAEKKASDPHVKAFAHKMMTEHMALDKAMKPYAEQWQIAGPTDLDDAHKSIYKKLSGLSGKKFDEEYMSAMVSDHHKAEELFKTEIEDTKDLKFRQSVEDGYSHIVAHDNMAKSLKGEV